MAKHKSIKGNHTIITEKVDGKLVDINVTELGIVMIKLEKPRGIYTSVRVGTLSDLKNVLLARTDTKSETFS